MLERLPVRRHVRRLSLLALALMLLTALSGMAIPVVAAVIPKSLDNTQADFAQGDFQRTAISAGTSDAVPLDEDGTLQLAAVGQLRKWDVILPDLPVPLGYAGVTTIGKRLYTVAGATSGTGQQFTNSVFWATVDQQSGSFQNHGLTVDPPEYDLADDVWINDPLPRVEAFMSSAPKAECTTEKILSRRGPAVASFVTGTGTDYIYVIGGGFVPSFTPLCDRSILASPAVQVGAVNTTSGDITWSKDAEQQNNYLPSPNLPRLDDETWETATHIGLEAESLGVEGAAAVIMRTSNGTAYLYVIGGVSAYVDDNGSGSLVTPAVFYTRLNPSTGGFVNPVGGSGTPWARAANVPLNVVYGSATLPGDIGIYNHTAIVSRATVGAGTGTTIKEAIYVTGGFITRPSAPSAANSFVFRATFTNEATGAIEWKTALNPPRTENVSTDGQGRGGAAGFAYGSKLYVIGGVPNGTGGTAPLGTITSGVHDDNMNMLPLFGSTQSPEYFVGGTGAAVIDPNPTYGLGAGVIPATARPGETLQHTAWGYAVGGFGQNGAATERIFRGKIGGPGETDATKRAPEGWYYSRFFDIQLDGDGGTRTEARVVSINWYTDIDRASNTNADLYIEFRRTKLAPCNEAAFANSEWQRLDGNVADQSFYSLSGTQQNRVLLSDIISTPSERNARCLQYRVYMTQNGSTGGVPNPPGNNALTPRLFKVEVETTKPGDTDLKLAAFEIGANSNGQFSSSTFDLRIINLNNTVADTVEVPGGNFPVVLCVAFSETDPNVPLTVPTLPITGDDDRVDCAPVYRFVDAAATTPNVPFALTSEWDANYDNVVEGRSQDERLTNISEAFTKKGYYAVAALIDPYNAVLEGGLAKANNRGENLTADGQPLIRRFQITNPLRYVYLPIVVR
ncbi:MAG: hypothetical protein HGA45_10465 [Chloroflexales bacterium]|nr:hypothetical protein [Chloroflexales bacterium]